jgi:hypothetical protein
MNAGIRLAKFCGVTKDATFRYRQIRLICSRIPQNILPYKVGETYGTSGQCVSFSLVDARSVLLPA